MPIKIKHKDPKSTNFGPNDIVINIKKGTIFYKSEKGIFTLQGDNLNTPEEVTNFEGSITATKGFFKSPGIGKLKVNPIKGTTNTSAFKFKVGAQPTLEVKGHIIPSASSQPRHDLGSLENPWRHFYVSPNSFFFVKQRAGVGGSRIGSTFIVGEYRKETIKETETLSEENVTDLKSGKSLSGSGDLNVEGKLTVAAGITLTAGGITGSIDTTIDGGSF